MFPDKKTNFLIQRFISELIENLFPTKDFYRLQLTNIQKKILNVG
jgi:hypothetical protein